MTSRKTASDETPGGIIDLWEPMAIHELTDRHTICVLGVELRVRGCRPAERGGDFFTLEATRTEELPHGGTATGIVVVEVDRNRLVPARVPGDSARDRTCDHSYARRHQRDRASARTL